MMTAIIVSYTAGGSASHRARNWGALTPVFGFVPAGVHPSLKIHIVEPFAERSASE